MRSRLNTRSIRYEVVDDHLVRTVTKADGRSYVHRCTRRVFEDVLHVIEAQPGPFTVTSLAHAADAAFTQVNVALEFLKERGCVETRLRRNYRASDVLFEDAMCEWCALAENV
jgi:hypothetical protein